MKIINKLFLFRKSEEISYELKQIYAYRYISLLLTSIFYLFKGENFAKSNCIFLVICLITSAIILNYMYLKYRSYLILVKILITIETISNVIILIPTGGLMSPYIWYSLNTVLLISYFLSSWYFYFNLLTYTTLLSILSYVFFDKSLRNLVEFFSVNANLILSYALIIIAIKLLMKLDKKLNDKSNNLALVNKELSEANKLNEALLVNEEQHRIANEIHDSVSQRLFYISCKINFLKHNINSCKDENLVNELVLIEEVLHAAIKELRETIYNYSEKNMQINSFEKILKEYINEVSKINNISIKLQINGTQDYMSSDAKKAIYRIISEAIGNSIRHGKSNNITLSLCSNEERTLLSIKDDGIGFSIKDKIKSNNTGLGIKNLRKLVNCYNGYIEINSDIKKGTLIKINIPRDNLMKNQGEVI